MTILEYFEVEDFQEIGNSIKLNQIQNEFPSLKNCTHFSPESDEKIIFYNPEDEEFFTLDFNLELLVRHATMYKIQDEL